jgi:type III pantothenate kinase
MQLLVVDIGNTDIKFGIFRDNRLMRHWRASGTRSQPERFSALLRESLAQVDADFSALAYSSVVPDIDPVLRKTIQYCFHLPDQRIFAIQPERSRLPVDFSRYAPGQLGMDRLVNVCGARFLHPDTHLVIADFGTATTFDLVSAEGIYLGGAIAPGLMTFADSLPEKTARLPRITPFLLTGGKTADDIDPGLNTVACLEAGIGLGYRGLTRELLEACIRALGADEVQVVATGGLAEPVIRLCGLASQFHQIDPTLTLSGLYHLYQFNQNPVSTS